MFSFVMDAMSSIEEPERRASRGLGLLFAIFCRTTNLAEYAIAPILGAYICDTGGLPPKVELPAGSDLAEILDFRRFVVAYRRDYLQSGLTTDEARRMIGCTVQHVRRLARTGRIEARVSATGAWICNSSSVANYRGRFQ